MKDDFISYERLGKAQAFYRACGYRNIEVPWAVSPEAIRVTIPPGAQMYSSPIGVLIASGEQGFIELMRTKTLQPGKWQTTTPCFRDEREYNELTRQSFMKTELIWYQPDDPAKALEAVLNDASNCLFEISDVTTYEWVQTPEGIDIYYNGVELGSYGVRKIEDRDGKPMHTWIYGTGLAEPRFSIVMKRQFSLAPVISLMPPPVSTESSEPETSPAVEDTSTSSTVQAQA